MISTSINYHISIPIPVIVQTSSETCRSSPLRPSSAIPYHNDCTANRTKVLRAFSSYPRTNGPVLPPLRLVTLELDFLAMTVGDLPSFPNEAFRCLSNLTNGRPIRHAATFMIAIDIEALELDLAQYVSCINILRTNSRRASKRPRRYLRG